MLSDGGGAPAVGDDVLTMCAATTNRFLIQWNYCYIESLPHSTQRENSLMNAHTAIFFSSPFSFLFNSGMQPCATALCHHIGANSSCHYVCSYTLAKTPEQNVIALGDTRAVICIHVDLDDLPFKQILLRLKISRVSFRFGGPWTNKLIAIGTSSETLPVHGK